MDVPDTDGPEISMLLVLGFLVILEFASGTFIVAGEGRVGKVPDRPVPPGLFARGRCLIATDVVL